MQNNRPSLPVSEKIAFITLGIVVFLGLLEVGLRFGGFVFSRSQENRNRIALQQRGTYRIMCIGESTTAGEYPPFLEEILNKRNIGFRFSVIDKGTVATTTSAIVAQLESYLNTYRPDMVVAMLGINDYAYHMPRDDIPPEALLSVFTSLRIYKLARLLMLHFCAKIREIKTNSSDCLKGPTTGMLHACAYASETVLATAETQQGQHASQTERSPSVSLIATAEETALIQRIRDFRGRGQNVEAVTLLTRAVERYPNNHLFYVELGWCYRSLGRFAQGVEAFNKAIERNPRSDTAYVGLGWCYLHLNKPEQTAASFTKAFELNPANDYAYEGLGQALRNQSRYAQAAYFYEKAIAANPANDVACVDLAWCYTQQGKFNDAIKLLKNAIERNPQNDRLIGGLIKVYEESGDEKMARPYYRRMNALRRTFYSKITKDNYRKIKEILDRRGIRLVCVQYPARSVKPLKEIFYGQEGITFVDNEMTFKDAAKKSGYGVYFRDSFGGDFGHCTPAGNTLLAKNIADTILREVFGK